MAYVLEKLIRDGTVEEARAFLTIFPKLVDQDVEGRSFLSVAVELNRIDIFDLMMNMGSRHLTFIHSDDRNRTVLHYAVMDTNLPMVITILRWGRHQLSAREFAIFVDGSSGSYPLSYAVDRKCPIIVELLLRAGEFSSHRRTELSKQGILHSAISNPVVLPILLRYGLDPNTIPNWNTSVLDTCLTLKSPPAIIWLIRVFGGTKFNLNPTSLRIYRRELTPEQLEAFDAPISESTILKCRAEVYFSQSLTFILTMEMLAHGE